jgi:gliding motility-associated protein GldM
MAGGKETPRQRMIGILYLVLLGLIALSVNDSLLDAFRNIRESLTTSTNNVNDGVNATFDSYYKNKVKIDSLKYKPRYDLAKKASTLSRDLENYIKELKEDLSEQGGGINENSGDLEGRANVDISPRFMINEGKALELRKKINKTRQELLNLLDPNERKLVKISLSTIDPPAKAGVSKSWEESNFGNGIPLTAALTALTKIQSDVKAAEYEMIKVILAEQIDIPLDRFAAVAVAPTSYIIQGQPYTAEIFLTAYSSTLDQSISVGGVQLPVRDGKGIYTVNTMKEGTFSWVGNMTVIENGQPKTYSTPEQKYQVARPSAVVSPDNMNVIVAGVPNPFSVSAPGIPLGSIQVSMKNGTISGSGGKYTVNSTSVGATAVITVTANIGGKVIGLGSTNFRVKKLPDPVAKFGNALTGATLDADWLADQVALLAVPDPKNDSGFSGVNYKILSWRLRVFSPGSGVRSATGSTGTLNSNALSALGSITAGGVVSFDNIQATGPDGVTRTISPITLYAN